MVRDRTYRSLASVNPYRNRGDYVTIFKLLEIIKKLIMKQESIPVTQKNEGVPQIENKEEAPKKYKNLVVAPCFEENEHHSGLDWNTRLRLLSAATLFEEGRAEKIIVGGGRLREMKESFAKLMKKELIKRGIREDAIETEEYTFDTASQIYWMKNNLEKQDGNLGFITDLAQAEHIGALRKGFGMEKEMDILSLEKIIEAMPDNKHRIAFLEKIHDSFDWKKFEAREKILALFTKYFDPKGEMIGKIAQFRKN